MHNVLALPLSLASTTHATHAEQVEDVSSTCSSAHAGSVFHSFLSILVINFAFLLISKDFICLINLLELFRIPSCDAMDVNRLTCRLIGQNIPEAMRKILLVDSVWPVDPHSLH